MKTMKQKLIVFLMLLVLLFTNFTFAYAEEETDAATVEVIIDAKEISIPLFNSPQHITLPHTITSFWFMIPNNTDVNSAGVTLILDSADCILEDYSFATLSINDVNIETINLISLRKDHNNVWTVEIPVEYLKTDGSLNQLSIVTAQRSILGDCADIDNPANWLIISDKSTLDLKINSFGDCTLATMMDYMFNRVDIADTIGIGFVLPAQAKESSINAMLSLSSAFGASYPYKNILNMPVYHAGDNTETENTIYIDEKIPQESGIAVTEAGNGYLKVSASEGKTTAFVVGTDANGLKKAVDVVLYSSYLKQLSGTEAQIYSTVKPVYGGMRLDKDGMYTLEDYGYDSINLAGAFHQQTSFTVVQPKGEQSGPDSYFEIHFKHSKALLSDSSLLTVLFNNVAAASIQLTSTNATGGSLKVKIPEEALKHSEINITVDVYNYLGKIDCSKDWYDVAWTVIDKDSVVFFQEGDYTTTATLENFPALPAVENGKEHVALITLPQNASATVLQAMNQLAARAGQKTRSASEFRIENDINKDNAKGKDIFILGSVSGVTIPEEIKKELNIVPDGNTFRISDYVSTIPEALSGKLIVQTIRSPYDHTRMVYVILWPDGQEDLLLQFASDKKTMDSLQGVVALVGTGTSLVTLENMNVEPNEVPMTFDRAVNKVVNCTGISRVGLIIIAVLILILIIFIIRALRKKNRFSRAKEKMQKTNAAGSDPVPAPAETKTEDQDETEE